MQRAGKKRNVPRIAKTCVPRAVDRGGAVVAPFEPRRQKADAPAAQRSGADHDASADRRRQLPGAIRQRIESRLPGRVRDLVVRLFGDTVVLEGRCATYYTKQLAQHAALGILEDEHLENAIVVSVPR